MVKKYENHPLAVKIRELGLTRQEFADRCNISIGTIQNIIGRKTRGRGKYYSDVHRQDTYQLIAEYLKISIREAIELCDCENKEEK